MEPNRSEGRDKLRTGTSNGGGGGKGDLLSIRASVFLVSQQVAVGRQGGGVCWVAILAKS
jgi:hypothetical protein